MKTLKDIRKTVIDDLDLSEEDFANDDDIDRWIRDGVSIAENKIHSLYQDYFLSVTQPIVLTGSLVDYPEDIYLNKIRTIILKDSTGTIYEIKKSRKIKDDMMYEMYSTTSSAITDTLRWYPMNTATDGRKIRITPENAVSGSITIMYIRNAKKLVFDSDICDIDEFARVIEQHAKTQAYLKDGDPRATDSSALEKFYVNEMEQSLKDMAADNDNELDVDLSHYEESV